MTVEIEAGEQSFRVVSGADVVRVLDQLTATVTAPTLIRLRASETVLHIGIGDPMASVALFLDPQGRPFFAKAADADGTGPDVLSFAQDGVTRRFKSHSRLTPAAARNAAIDFVLNHGARPSRLHWIAEGPHDGL